jgi:hypothetical protein
VDVHSNLRLKKNMGLKRATIYFSDSDEEFGAEPIEELEVTEEEDNVGEEEIKDEEDNAIINF